MARYRRRKRRYKRRSKIGSAWKAGDDTPSAMNMRDNYSKGCLWG